MSIGKMEKKKIFFGERVRFPAIVRNAASREHFTGNGHGGRGGGILEIRSCGMIFFMYITFT